MSDMTTKRHEEILRHIVFARLKPVHEENGFLMNAKGYYQHNQNILKTVELERFRFNSYAKYFFWFNVALFGGCYQRKIKYTSSLGHRHGIQFFHSRIGALWHEDAYMYEIAPEQDCDDLSNRITRDVEGFVFPLLDKYARIDDLLRDFPEENYKLAIMYSNIGEIELGKKYFERAIEKDSEKFVSEFLSRERYIQNVKDSATRFGIVL